MDDSKLNSIVSMVSGFNGPLVVPVIELVAEYKILRQQLKELKAKIESDVS